MKRILLYEPNKQSPKHISLLLKVADFDCVVAESIDEVLNWLSIAQLDESRFDLLLLNAWPNMAARKELFEELTGKLSIPVIYILRDGQHHPSLDDRKVSICHPENMLSCIYSHLVKSFSEYSHNICAIAARLFSTEEGFINCCSCLEIAKLKGHKTGANARTYSCNHHTHSGGSQALDNERICI